MSESSPRDLAFVNTLVLWLCRVLIVVPQLVLVPYLIRNLGPSAYGVFTMVWALLMGVDQLERSLQSGVIKYGAAMLATKESVALNRLLSSSQLFSLVLGAAATTGIACWALLWRSTGATAAMSLMVVAAIPPIVMPLTPYVAVIQAGRRFYIGAAAETLGRYLSLGVIVLWFQGVSPSLNAVVIIMALALLLSRAVQVPFARRLVPGIRIRAKSFDRASLKLIARFGSVISLASLFLVLNSTGVRWMMGLLASTAFVADLAIMLMPGILMEQLVSAVTITVMPAASAYDATKRNEHLSGLLIAGTRYAAVLTASVVLAFSLALRDILSVWIGPDYVRLAGPTTVVLAGQAALLVTSTAHHMLKGMGRLRVIVVAYGVGLVLTPGIAILSILGWTGDPYLAVMVGLPVGAAVAGGIQLSYALSEVGLTWARFMREALGPPAAVTIGVAAICWPVVLTLPVDGSWARLAVAAAATILMAVGSYLWVAREDERQFLRGWLAGVLTHLRKATHG